MNKYEKLLQEGNLPSRAKDRIKSPMERREDEAEKHRKKMKDIEEGNFDSTKYETQLRTEDISERQRNEQNRFERVMAFIQGKR